MVANSRAIKPPLPPPPPPPPPMASLPIRSTAPIHPILLPSKARVAQCIPPIPPPPSTLDSDDTMPTTEEPPRSPSETSFSEDLSESETTHEEESFTKITHKDLVTPQKRSSSANFRVYATSSDVCGKCGNWQDQPPSYGGPWETTLHPLRRQLSPYTIGYIQSPDKAWTVNQIWITDKALTSVLEPFFESYVSTSTSLISYPFYPFIQQWDKIMNAASRRIHEATYMRLISLMFIIEPSVSWAIQARRKLLKTGLIEFSNLHIAFTPGELVVVKGHNGSISVGILGSANLSYSADVILCWDFAVEHLDWDGKRSVVKRETYNINVFGGERPLAEMDVVPLDLHPDKEELRRDLIARGRKLESLRCGLNTMYYDGRTKEPLYPGEELGDRALFPRKIRERVTIAPQYFHDYEMQNPMSSFPASTLNPADAVARTPMRQRLGYHNCSGTAEIVEETDHPDKADTYHDSEPELDRWTDEQCLMAVPYIWAYSEALRMWYTIRLEKLSDIDWTPKALDNGKLFLAEETKYLLRSVVRKLDPRRRLAVEVDELGLYVMLFWGVPGTGKFKTISAVCEEFRILPYELHVSSVAGLPNDFERELVVALRRCTQMERPLVIRDAHVLFGRTSDNGGQNLSTMIFLRHIAEFKGVVFLTTHTNEALAPAVDAFIDARVSFGQMTEETRLAIWRQELVADDIADYFIQVLAARELTATQIRGAVKMAKVLADNEPEPFGKARRIPLNTNHILRALDFRLTPLDASTGLTDAESELVAMM